MVTRNTTNIPSLVRLNRYLSICGTTSRRKADQLIEDGLVSVNGHVVTTLGTKIDPEKDVVRIEGKQITQVHGLEYLVLNKPKDSITTTRDERGRRTVMDLVRTKKRLYPVGRLDRATTGVLLFTNDGVFANHLMHPRHRIAKTYRVRCDSAVTTEDLHRLRTGIKLEDGMTQPATAAHVAGAKKREVEITIHEGRNRQLRRMFEALGYRVRALDRVAYGPVTCSGLKRGDARRLTSREIRMLRQQAGIDPEKAS